MTLHRMDHVGIIVDDLDAATAFFAELGLERIGGMSFEDPLVDRINNLDGIRCDMAMMEVPGSGHGRLELIQFNHPPGRDPDPSAPSNTIGLRHLCFAVDSLDDALERLRPLGAELVGEVVRYGDTYVLAYVRGPAGIILELAEKVTAEATPA